MLILLFVSEVVIHLYNLVVLNLGGLKYLAEAVYLNRLDFWGRENCILQTAPFSFVYIIYVFRILELTEILQVIHSSHPSLQMRKLRFKDSNHYADQTIVLICPGYSAFNAKTGKLEANGDKLVIPTTNELTQSFVAVIDILQTSDIKSTSHDIIMR